ncbi:MAG: ABC transporter substrate-binding protein, partial [Clostridia bacterium]|nr:ABC transporter substrate-binding protein [Clostridia bacterium]
TAAATVDAETGEIVFRDFDGNLITMSGEPSSVASLCEISTEIICGLGAGRYITAMNESSSKLEGAPISAEVLMDFYSDTNRLIEMAPDIIFYSDNSLSVIAVTVLKNAGLTVVRIPEKGDIITAESNIRFISALMYKDAVGERMITEMRADIDRMKIAAELVGVRKTVYIEGAREYGAYGVNTIASELCAYAGGDNVYSDRYGEFTVTAAEISSKDPDVIIILTKDPENYDTDVFRKRPGLENMTAVRTKAVYAVDLTLATRPTQRITEALVQIGRALKTVK